MCTAMTHAFVALAAGAAYPAPVRPLRYWVCAIACSAGPDLDVGLHLLGVRYEDLWGHRGMTHSFLFAAVVAVLVVNWPLRRLARPLSRAWWGLMTFFFALTVSHGVLDAFTDGGLGIGFLSPFDPTRYFMPWQPLRVPEFGVRSLFTEYGGVVLVSEFVWVWLPAFVLSSLVIAARMVRGRSERQSTS